MSTEEQQPAQTPQTDERAPTPAAEPEARKLEIDDVESDEGDDVKGGGIGFNAGGTTTTSTTFVQTGSHDD